MVFQALISLTDEPVDETLYLAIANLDWALLSWPLISEADGSLQLDPNGKLHWHYVFNLDQYRATLAEPILNRESKIVLRVIEWSSPLRIMISAYSVDLCFAQLVFLAEHGLGIRKARSFSRIDLVKRLAQHATGDDDQFVSAIMAEIEAANKKKKTVEEEDAEGEEFAQMLLEHFDNDEAQEYQREMKIGVKEKNLKRKRWQQLRQDEVEAREKKAHAKKARAKSKFSVKKGKGKGKGKKGKGRGSAKVKRRLSFAAATNDDASPDDDGLPAETEQRPPEPPSNDVVSGDPHDEPEASSLTHDLHEEAEETATASQQVDQSDQVSVTCEPSDSVSNEHLFSLKAAKLDDDTGTQHDGDVQIAVASLLMEEVDHAGEAPAASSSSASAPPVAERGEEADVALVAAAAPGASKAAGIRGPHVHQSPGSLLTLAPPGATITLNSGLSPGEVVGWQV